MKNLLLALFLSWSTISSVQAQKHTSMNDEVYWLVGFAISGDGLEKFQEVVKKMVAMTTSEPGTLVYEYHIGPDGTTVDIFERYANSDGAIAHVKEMSARPVWSEFSALAKPIPGRFMVYGKASPELRRVLAGFNPMYFAPIDGFTR